MRTKNTQRRRYQTSKLALLLVGGLSACAFAQEEFKSAATITKPVAAAVPEPQKIAEKVSGVAAIPVLGPVYTAIFGPEPLPEDDEIAVPLDQIVDATPPQLIVHFVEAGRLRAYGPDIMVRGTVSDASRVALVTVNGYAARLDGTGFSRRIRVPVGNHRSVVQALDMHGNAALVQFDIVRRDGRDGGAPRRVGAGSLQRRGFGANPRQINAISDIDVPGTFLILLAGTPAMHAVAMPSLAHCRLAAGYSNAGTCAQRR
ncbi:MAG: hypothetical protein HOF70_21250 [Rhodospirillaceae bacterium]|nr:hypothetical protein [Rhodospirillaceae bacterium]MBT5838365.1 hypothetical protein [Rhodospirillaceae bacterium]